MFGFLRCLANTHCSYYYDTETGWYYLQSRYYDPVIHRFINADSYASTDTTDAISCNMFAYCNNNPVNASDPTGNDSSSDVNENGIADYLEMRWIRQTIYARHQIDDSTTVRQRSIEGGFIAVDCDVDFRKTEYVINGKTANFLDNEMYRYVFCQEIEKAVRNKEAQVIAYGGELAGSMSFEHIYKELTYHYLGYRNPSRIPTDYYKSCVVANLNYDEDRLICYPMKWIPVPSY